MADLTLQKISKAGAAISYVAAAVGGDSFKAVSGCFLHIVNADASPMDVTIPIVTDTINTGSSGDVTLTDIVVTVPATDERLIAIPSVYWGLYGNVDITYDSVTTLTVAVLYVE